MQVGGGELRQGLTEQVHRGEPPRAQDEGQVVAGRTGQVRQFTGSLGRGGGGVIQGRGAAAVMVRRYPARGFRISLSADPGGPVRMASPVPWRGRRWGVALIRTERLTKHYGGLARARGPRPRGRGR